MNEICLRTNKGAYDSGDVVYGIVYLRITSPTVGATVCLRATCVETVTGLTDSRSHPLPAVTHMDTGLLEIYRSRYDVIPFSKLAIPFRLRLPHELPGSFFYAVSDKDKHKEVKISHQLHAFVRGDEERLSTVQTIVVVHRTHALHDGVADPAALDLDEKLDIPFLFGLPRGYLHFQIRLLSKSCTFEGKPKMFMRIKNTSRRKLKEIRIMVIRTIVMTPYSSGTAAADSNVTVTSSKELMNLCLRELQPALLESGLDGIVLPLIHMTPDELLAQSTVGSYVKCTFNVHVEVELRDGPSIIRPTAIPLEVHATYNSEWQSQSLPVWRSHCKLVRAQDPDALWDDILGSEVYKELLPSSRGDGGPA